MCALCTRLFTDDNVASLGNKEGPFIPYHNSMLYVHNQCAIFASGNNGVKRDIEAGILRNSITKNLKCSSCRRKGGVTGCIVRSCKSTFHLPCALESGCQVADRNNIYTVSGGATSITIYDIENNRWLDEDVEISRNEVYGFSVVTLPGSSRVLGYDFSQWDL
jgi:hypothetical protein